MLMAGHIYIIIVDHVAMPIGAELLGCSHTSCMLDIANLGYGQEA